MAKKNTPTGYTPITQEGRDTLYVSVELVKQDIGYLKLGVDEIREELRQMRTDFKDGYVSRDEYTALSREVRDLKNLKDWAIKIVLGAVLVGLLALLGLRQ